MTLRHLWDYSFIHSFLVIETHTSVSHYLKFFSSMHLCGSELWRVNKWIVIDVMEKVATVRHFHPATEKIHKSRLNIHSQTLWNVISSIRQRIKVRRSFATKYMFQIYIAYVIGIINSSWFVNCLTHFVIKSLGLAKSVRLPWVLIKSHFWTS